MYTNLRYRRQFILTRREIKFLQTWTHSTINNYHLYAHPDLELTETKSEKPKIILLGYVFNPNNPEHDNEDIVLSLQSKCRTFDDLINEMKLLAGRYAIIYISGEGSIIFNDPLSLREVYYCTDHNLVICGSQPNLLNMYSEPNLGFTNNEDIRYFYEKEMPKVRNRRLWVGEETYFNKIRHLMPNHYLDMQTLTVSRYWPKKPLNPIKLKDAAEKASSYLRGVLRAVAKRYNVMMAVTAGRDSRSLLAASRDIKDNIYYFINKQKPLTDNSPDIRIPREMFKKLNIPFHIHEVNNEVDPEFRKIFLENVFMSTDLILPTIYNVYYRQHQDKLNLLGVGELGREYYGKAPHDLDGYYLARCLKYKNSEYATRQCEKWLEKTNEIAKACNVDIMKLFLWECLLGNWGVVGNSESDIAIEEFDPYDSHYIYEILLSANQRDGDLFDEMYRYMWPELLAYPFNPAESLTDIIKTWLNKIGILMPLKRAVYRYDKLKYKRKVSVSKA